VTTATLALGFADFGAENGLDALTYFLTRAVDGLSTFVGDLVAGFEVIVFLVGGFHVTLTDLLSTLLTHC
jgi:hypothetical protein